MNLIGTTKLTIDQLDAAIYALRFTFGDNAHERHDVPHNTRVDALRKLEEFRASLVVGLGVA